MVNYLKEIGKAKEEGKVIIFNFSKGELHYAHRDWIVINRIKKEEE